MNIHIYIILVLKEYLVHLWGTHYPTEIIGLIIRRFYKPIRVSCGLSHTTVSHHRGLYVWGQNVKKGNIDGKKSLYFRKQDINWPYLLSKIDISGCSAYYVFDSTSIVIQLCPSVNVEQHTLLSTWTGNNLCDHEERYIPCDFLPHIKSISCGYHHTCVVLNNDEIYVWGKNSFGQLGLGDYKKRKVPQKLNLLNVRSINCGGYYTTALMTDDKIYVWGLNDHGQLGFESYNKPTPTELKLNNVVLKISCGGQHTIVLTSSGKLYVWGFNYYGQLGLGDRIDKKKPTELVLSNIISIKCGEFHSMALTSDGEIYSWGANGEGQLGLGKNIYICQLVPQKISLSNVVSVGCGQNHAVAVTLYDEIYVWGRNYERQLGLGDDADRNEPCRLQWIEDQEI